MNATTHPTSPEEVMAFLDGELPAADAQSVSVHLEHCAECARIADQFRATSQSLSDWKVPGVPKKLEKSVTDLAAKIRSVGKIGTANIFIRASFWTWKQWTAGLGATAVALLLFLAIAIPRSKMPGSEAVARQRQRIDTAPFDGQPKVEPQGMASAVDKFSRTDGTELPAGSAAEAQRLQLFAKIQRPSQSAPVVQQPMIARTVSLTVVTKDFLASRASLDVILARHHGYAAQLTVSTTENAPRSLQASLRIPAAELSSAVAELKALGRVENESQGGEEVTQEHADLVARVKNSRATENRLQAILLQRTGKIADVLAVEQEIARVRGEIEQMEAEQKNLEHRVDFATVNLQLAEEYKAQLNPPAASVSTRIHNAFVAGYRGASETVLGFVLFLAESGPTLLIWILLFLVPGWLIWRRYRRSLAAA